jgi:hypothetical protein
VLRPDGFSRVSSAYPPLDADKVCSIWEAGRFLLPEIDLCGSPLTLVSGSLDQAEDPAVNYETLP